MSRRSVLYVEETGVPGEKHRTAASHGQILSHNGVSNTPRHGQNDEKQLNLPNQLGQYFLLTVEGYV